MLGFLLTQLAAPSGVVPFGEWLLFAINKESDRNF